MLQNAILLKKLASWPPNIYDEHVSCTAPATRHASLQILLECPRPAIVFGHDRKSSAHFGRVGNPLHLPRKTTSEPSKVVRACGVLYILTWKCASRHNGVHFFIISTSKSAPRMVCFVHFDSDMCFTPQRRALFHLSSGQMAPHPPLQPAYFSTLRSHKSLGKHSVSGLLYLFAHLHLLSSDSFSSLIFFHLYFSSLTLPTSAFPSVHIVGSLTSKLPIKITQTILMNFP